MDKVHVRLAATKVKSAKSILRSGGSTISAPAATVDATRRYDAFGNLENSTGTWNSASDYVCPYGYQEDADQGPNL